jgi:predicted nucleotidyltransferase
VGRIPDVESFAAQSQVLLLVHQQSGVPMDFILAWLPFEREALARAQPVSVDGVEIPMATAQDLIIYKVIAWRERDRRDVEELLRLHRSGIDLDYIRGRVAEFTEAIDEPARLGELDAIVARVDGEGSA